MMNGDILVIRIFVIDIVIVIVNDLKPIQDGVCTIFRCRGLIIFSLIIFSGPGRAVGPVHVSVCPYYNLWPLT